MYLRIRELGLNSPPSPLTPPPIPRFWSCVSHPRALVRNFLLVFQANIQVVRGGRGWGVVRRVECLDCCSNLTSPGVVVFVTAFYSSACLRDREGLQEGGSTQRRL